MKKLQEVLSLVAVMVFAVTIGVLFFLPDVRAGHRCPECDEWIETDEYCHMCYVCADCSSDYCDECHNCKDCVDDIGDTPGHCPDCGACIVELEGSISIGEFCPDCGTCYSCAENWCEACGLCSNCVEIFENDDHDICENCAEEADGQYCKDCGKVIHDTVGEPTDDAADCGQHCWDCYEEHKCAGCDACTDCEDLVRCETCGYCEDCAVPEEAHCELCLACYEEVNRCWQDGSHCVECCENEGWICAECGECAEGNGVEICEDCGVCENCADGEYHCSECGECYTLTYRCAQGGEHCEDCCEEKGYICKNCEECTVGNGIEFCEFCGLCENCCEANSKLLGFGDVCIKDKKGIETGGLKHDAGGKHILGYRENENAGTHTPYCLVSGCTYEEAPEAHTPDDEWYYIEGPYWGNHTSVMVRNCSLCDAHAVEKKEVGSLTAQFELCSSRFFAANDMSCVLDYKLYRYEVDGTRGLELQGPVYAVYSTDGTWPAITADSVVNFQNEAERSERCVKISAGKIPNKVNGKNMNNTALKWRLLYVHNANGKSYYSVYSDEFTVSWGDSHIHTFELVFSEICPEWVPQSPGAETPVHWVQCTECGYHSKRVSYCTTYQVLVNDTRTCTDPGARYYKCSICEGEWAEKYDTVTVDHVSDNCLKSNGTEHYYDCVVCGTKLLTATHNFKAVRTIPITCTLSRRELKCTECGYRKLESVTGGSHEYNINMGVYYDKDYHWQYCVKCNEIKKTAHSFVDTGSGKHCSFCFYFPPETNPGLEGQSWISANKSAACIHDVLSFKYESNYPGTMIRVYYWYANGTRQDALTNSEAVNVSMMPIDPKTDNIIMVRMVENAGGGNMNQTSDEIVVKAMVPVEGFEATCKETGMKAHYRCACGKLCDGNGNVINPVIPKSDHVYSDDCDESCDSCGELRTVEHAFGDGYSSDDTIHFVACAKCGYRKDAGLHTYDTVSFGKRFNCLEETTAVKICTECGYQKTETLSMTGHDIQLVEATVSTCFTHGYNAYYECANCTMHFKDEAGKERTGLKAYMLPLDPKNHQGSNTYVHDAEKHYILCVCGEKINGEAHTFNEKGGCVTCGYNPTIATHKPKSENGKPSNGDKPVEKPTKLIWLWILLAILGGLIVIGGATVATVVILKNKKKKNAEKS